MKSGIEYMTYLADWYTKNSGGKGVGFFQIGGGIAGDFPICVVPMLYQDMEMHDIPFWSYFCQISDSTTSYGSYSGAVPNEKITWGKLDIHTPKFIVEIWKDAEAKGERYFPHEYMYKMILSGVLEQYYEIPRENSWMIAAAEANLPIVVPGWEDSTMGNIFASYCIKGELKATTMKSGIEYMTYLADWYTKNSAGKGVGFFQIGGGIAGDFPICVVPMLYQDMEMHDIPFWSYFCQISDSTTSYGSYSGAVPNEKITWGKLDITTPKFIVESDATICAPLMFSYILENA